MNYRESLIQKALAKSPKNYLTIKDCADIFDYSPSKMRVWVRDGLLTRYILPGKRPQIRITIASVLERINEIQED